MSDLQAKLGKTLLTRLAALREQKTGMNIEDVGAMFMEMASSMQTQASAADQVLRKEIEKLAVHIEEAKKEIFAISTNEKAEKAITDASLHLDEVIKATEEATNTIMDAADAIQNSAAGVGGEKEQQIVDASLRIYEACNFQDITGQRIRKVIKLLSSIEDRVGKLIGLFGAYAGQEAANDQPRPLTDQDLLNGPQLSSQAASQADIDALFGSTGS